MSRQSLLFFFQAEDGIRFGTVTGVQTCALPISRLELRWRRSRRACAQEWNRGWQQSGRVRKKGGEKLWLRKRREDEFACSRLPADGISDGFPVARSRFQHDHDGRLLLKAEYRDARGLPGNILLRMLQEVLQFLDGLSIECQQDITGRKAGFGCITCVGYFEQDHARFTWAPRG